MIYDISYRRSGTTQTDVYWSVHTGLAKSKHVFSVVHCFLQQADVNAQNDFGETPLHLAAARNLPEMWCVLSSPREHNLDEATCSRCLADLGANLGIREQ